MDLGYIATSLGPFAVIARLGFAAVFGAIVGIDRELRHRPAGLRTHMLVALAAAALTILAIDMHEQLAADEPRATADPIRVVEAVTAGVAFLAAGAIIRARGEVYGLTTGAGMWLAGAIGVACGSGRYLIAVVALVLAFVIVSVMRPVEKGLIARWKRKEREAEAAKEPPHEPPEG